MINTKRPKRILLHDGEWWAEEITVRRVKLLGDEAPSWATEAIVRIVMPGSLDPAPSGHEYDAGVDE